MYRRAKEQPRTPGGAIIFVRVNWLSLTAQTPCVQKWYFLEHRAGWVLLLRCALDQAVTVPQ
jgi:hypothetical protein